MNSQHFRSLTLAVILALVGVIQLSSGAIAAPLSNLAALVTELEQETKGKVPILLPDDFPGLTSSMTPESYATEYLYILEIRDYSRRCRKICPPFILVKGDKGETLLTEGKIPVSLTQGISGYYSSHEIQWFQSGVLYSIYLEQGTQTQLTQMANSAILAGAR